MCFLWMEMLHDGTILPWMSFCFLLTTFVLSYLLIFPLIKRQRQYS